MHLNSELLLQKYALSYFKSGFRVLEIGPDAIPSAISKLVNDPTIVWETLNMEVGESTSRARNSDLTIVSAFEYSYPIADNTYDIVVSANVMEHVRKFWKWFEELKRITKPGGFIITVAPISWPHHDAPVDCWRIYPEGIRALYEEIHLTDVFSTFESLEAEKFADQPYTPLTPWASTVNEKKVRLVKRYNSVLRWIPMFKPLLIPLTISYDLITIAKKEL